MHVQNQSDIVRFPFAVGAAKPKNESTEEGNPPKYHEKITVNLHQLTGGQLSDPTQLHAASLSTPRCFIISLTWCTESHFQFSFSKNATSKYRAKIH